MKEEELKAMKEKDFGGENEMTHFFKEIYASATPEQKRAMVKSFQTSNGQVLSTNWDEVKDKDYEGKDRLEAPKGFKYLK